MDFATPEIWAGSESWGNGWAIQLPIAGSVIVPWIGLSLLGFVGKGSKSHKPGFITLQTMGLGLCTACSLFSALPEHNASQLGGLEPFVCRESAPVGLLFVWRELATIPVFYWCIGNCSSLTSPTVTRECFKHSSLVSFFKFFFIFQREETKFTCLCRMSRSPQSQLHTCNRQCHLIGGGS